MNSSSVPLPTAVGQRLAGKTIAVSVSEAHDLEALGFAPDQIDRVLQALLVPLVADGARIAYGGRVEHPHNFTLVMSRQLGEAYRRLDQAPGHRPFVHFLAQHRFATTEPAVLLAHLRALAPYGEVWVVGEQGVLGTLAAESSSAEQVAACASCGLLDSADLQTGAGVEALGGLPLCREWRGLPVPAAGTSFTAMRQEMARRCDARVLIGGRKTGFTGDISGICEEALLTIEAGKPLLVVGGFGGASRNVAIALGLLDEAARVPGNADPDEARYREGLERLQLQQAAFQALFGPADLERVQALARTESTVDGAEMLLTLLSRCL